MMSLSKARPLSRARQSWPGITRLMALATGLAIGLAAAARASQSAPLVRVDVAVVGTDGKPITGLTRDDFEIVAGGATRAVESFAAGKEPLTLVLLFDVTVSLDTVVGRKVVRTAVEKWFVDRLAPEDRVHVGSFANQISIGPPLAGHPRTLIAAVRKALDPREADTFGRSPVWDAVDAAVATLARASGRRAVLLVTDGRATGNRQGPEEAGALAIAAGVIVSVVGEDWEMTLRQDGATGVRVRPGIALEWIAKATGGLYVQDTATPAAPGPIFERLLADLHERYTIGFTPAVRDGVARTLEVRVKRPGVTVRSRSSYVATVNP
jgi:Ca-activated chloride channel homolog